MDITKEEIFAYTDAATKTATALEKIADRLVDISTSQHDCQGKFCTQLIELVKTNQNLLKGIEDRTVSLANDMLWMKWIWTSLAGVVALGWAITEVFQKIHQ